MPRTSLNMPHTNTDNAAASSHTMTASGTKNPTKNISSNIITNVRLAAVHRGLWGRSRQRIRTHSLRCATACSQVMPFAIAALLF